MDQRARDQLAKNEALFREVNERVKEIERSHNMPTADRWDFLCECGNATCMERVPLTVAQYERVRSDPAQFDVVPGHEVPDVEVVVRATDEYAVIRKTRGEERIAPRDRPESGIEGLADAARGRAATPIETTSPATPHGRTRRRAPGR